MCRRLIILTLLSAVVAGIAPITRATLITSVVRRNPDDNSGDTEPQIAPGPLIEDALCYVDRTAATNPPGGHQYNSIPAYLIGAEYVMTANDDKNNGSHELDVTLSQAVTVYLFLDNRLQATGTGSGTGEGVTPDLSGMPWVAAMGFTDMGDDIGIDEGGNGSIDRWSSVFSNNFPAGTITLLGQPQGYTGNMYGVAVTVPQLKASNPNPTNGAMDVPTNVMLSWTPESGAISHDIYIGTNQADVAAGTPDTYKGTVTETSYNPPGALAYGTTYYWRVDEFDGTTTYPGNVWRFTTQGQGEGHILFEYFWGTDGTLESLLNLPTFPDSPDQSEFRTSFEGRMNWRETYGTHVRGYLYPPETGNYTFWIASDDQSQLRLSIDEDPANAVQIARVPGWANARQWDKYPEQKSQPQSLEAGKRYYIEALHCEGGGGDNLAVAWQGPTITTRVVISGTFLAPWIREIDLKANNPSPADGAILVPTDVVLNWTPGVYAAQHDVYLGTDSLAVETANTSTPGIYRGRQVTESYIPPEGIQFGQTYYWRIDEINPTRPDSPWLGDVWSFTTTGIDAPPILIPTDTSVGEWDPGQRIYTLTKDVPQCMQVVEDNLILDGAGHKIVGPGSGNGVNLSGRTEVTIQNLTVSQFDTGIYLNACSNITLTGNTASNNYRGFWINFSISNDLIGNTCSNNRDGIWIYYSPSNTLIGNNLSNNQYDGIWIYYSDDNNLTGNTASNNAAYCGIHVEWSNNNILSSNTANSNPSWSGIFLQSANNNTLTNNTASNNSMGILVGYDSSNNTLTGNTCNSNGYIGIAVSNSNDNQIYNNNFIDNSTQARVDGGSGNIFNLDKPTGGNFWSDWTTPDADHDGFVDIPYVFTGGQDNLPWTRHDYWLSADSDGVSDGIEDGAPNGGDGNSDGIPDGQQDNVTSLPNAVDQEYATIVSAVGTTLENVSAGDNPSPGDAPAGVEFPVGFFDFTVSGIAPGGSTTVTLLLPAGHTVGTYYKYGPTSDNLADHWYEFLWDATTQTGAEILSDRIILHFVDGLRGDDDLTVNGQIVEPGAPAARLVQTVGIDIYPNRTPNMVYLSKNYTISVVVFGSASFNVTSLNSSTVRFGRTGTEAAPVRAPTIRDMNGDKLPDAMYGFLTFNCGFQLGNTEGILTGSTTSGVLIEGRDSVVVSP